MYFFVYIADILHLKYHQWSYQGTSSAKNINKTILFCLYSFYYTKVVVADKYFDVKRYTKL